MLTTALRYLGGYVLLRAEGGSPERFLNLCSYREIVLWDVKPAGNAYEMKMWVRDVKRLAPVLRKSGVRIRIQKRIGLPFFLHRYRKQKVFFAGLFLAPVLIGILSLFVWNIQITGNLHQTTETLLEFLETEGVYSGMPVSQVDCEKIGEEIRREFPDIIWVSASLEGSRLHVQVKEGLLEEEPGAQEEPEAPTDIVAESAGTIASIVTRSGTPLVQEGDAFEAGDVLVSGNVAVTNDMEEITGYQYQNADADIQAYTERSYEDTMSLTRMVPVRTGKKRAALWLGTEKSRFFLGIRHPGFDQYVVSTREKRLQPGENFFLPFSVGILIAEEVRYEEQEWSREEYRQILTETFERECQNLEKKGVQILQNNVKIYKEKSSVSARGTLSLLGPVGTSQSAQKLQAPQAAEPGIQEGN